MNSLLEPTCAPALPDFMLLDEEDHGCGADEAWPTVGLASFAPLMVGRASAPVPIAAPSGGRLGSSSLVDSLESTQTLLGASLQDSATAAAAVAAVAQALTGAMRFVPVGASAPPEAAQQPASYLFQQQPRYAAASSPRGRASPGQGSQQESPELLFEGYGAVAAPQPYQPASLQPGQPGAQQQGWELPQSMVPIPAPAAGAEEASEHQPTGGGGAAGVSGISSFDLQYGFSAQFGSHLSFPSAVRCGDDRMRRALSEEALQIGNYRGSGYGALTSVAEADNSEGSDADTHHALLAPARGLPVSHSAPSVSHMALERSGSSRRPSGHAGAAAARAAALTSSPRTVGMKLKASRPRPVAAVRAAVLAATAGEPAGAAAGGLSASPRPARFAARRSVALSAAAAAEEDFDTDSEGEAAPSLGGSEERRSGGSVSTGGAREGGAAGGTGKKKHNPWSLTETEALVEGVRLLGPSKWAEIKKLAVGGIADLLTNRSAVDLKDKWRNLTRVAKLPKSVLKQRAHKSSSDIPLDLLLTVKDLMEVGRE